MSMETQYLVAIGTKKGLWLARSQDRREWTLDGPHFLMTEIPSIGIDSRNGTRIMVGIRSEHWGPTVAHSDDLGASWTEPEGGGIAFGEDDGAAVERIWQLQPDRAGRPGVVWAGVEPISLWRSDDGGEHFTLNRALWEHPHKPEWGEGAGGGAVHSIVPGREDGTVHVAMSTGGVYRTLDGGASWEARSKGITASFMPDPLPEFGQCVHKIAGDADVPGRLYAQNHGGVFRTDDNGDSWRAIENGLPANFGFVMLSHPRTSGTAWVIPLRADVERIPVDGHLAVGRTRDGGDHWEMFDSGLPEHDYNSILRDAAGLDTAEPVGVYFGTRGGSVYASADEGATFQEIASHLPDVLCVRAAAIQPTAGTEG
ncbi:MULTISPECIES: exo-alpha-sialidase [Arthrobacter]|uniref:Exo-alpha-sialidase n=2 Tax=Arthrobacter TaxID=1663 RepID=A0ABU9KL82_9MICC|nr:exo-alpha-sialidase [Arthrobacter sp. YJM1]MDP5226824.1 exo-alpha-sialidase [Arthrobacter sp. YJM1]